LPSEVTWNSSSASPSGAVAYYADQEFNLAAVEFDPSTTTLDTFIPPTAGPSDDTTGIYYDAERDLVWYTRSPDGTSTGSIWTADSSLSNELWPSILLVHLLR